MHQKINNQQDFNKISDTPSIKKQKQSSQNEPPISENRNTSKPNNTQPNNTDQALTQEQKVNQENLKRIMNGEKTTLLSLRNIEWRTVKTEMENIESSINLDINK